MITMLRTTENVNTAENEKASTFDMLEKKANSAVYNAPSFTSEETELEARERMQKNLDKLMNYDRFSDVAVEDTKEVEEANIIQDITNDEDIRPSSTTMQFGNDGVDGVFQDLNRQKEEQHVKSSVKLNKKGKLLLFLYSLTVFAIFALIILNTSLLTSLTRKEVANAELLNQKQIEYAELNEKIETAKSNETILDIAENQYGMVK